MNKDFETLWAERSISLMELIRIPEEVLKRIVKHDLASKIAELIVERKDELPVKFTEGPLNDGKVIRLRVNLISDDEYRRLKNIESRYFEEHPGRTT